MHENELNNTKKNRCKDAFVKRKKDWKKSFPSSRGWFYPLPPEPPPFFYRLARRSSNPQTLQNHKKKKKKLSLATGETGNRKVKLLRAGAAAGAATDSGSKRLAGLTRQIRYLLLLVG